jgi:uncharacterized membrane protein YfcA
MDTELHMRAAIIHMFDTAILNRIRSSNNFGTTFLGVVTAAIAIAAGNATNGHFYGGLPVIAFLVPLFFIISFFYSSVGFGGGSSYIAILVLTGVSLSVVSSTALILNIVAASMAFTNFARSGYLSIKFTLPFLSSIPFAFVAGLIVLPPQNLVWIFGTALFAASAALFITSRVNESERSNFHSTVVNALMRAVGKENQTYSNNTAGNNFGGNKNRTPPSVRRVVLIGLPLGATIGTIAGLVGIGGGIWLSPFFILTNSASGFIAHSISKPIDFPLLVPLACAVFIGGFIGSRFGAFKFNHNRIRVIVACLVSVAGIIIILKSIV